jgi:hypothetical protein
MGGSSDGGGFDFFDYHRSRTAASVVAAPKVETPKSNPVKHLYYASCPFYNDEQDRDQQVSYQDKNFIVVAASSEEAARLIRESEDYKHAVLGELSSPVILVDNISFLTMRRGGKILKPRFTQLSTPERST